MKLWKQRVKFLVVLALMLSVMCISASAASSGGDSDAIVSAFTTGFQGIVSDAKALIAAAAPTALSLAAVIFLARKAMSWFKSMAK